MKKFTVRVNVKLDLKVLADNKDKALLEAQDHELPHEYVEDSFEIDSVRNEKGESL